MKKLIALLVLVLGATAQANTETKPLIVKSSSAGFAPVDYVFGEKCEVYADKVVITKAYGMGETKTELSQTIPVKITGNLDLLLEKVAQETLEEKENMMCDAPGTSIRAMGSEDIVLYSTGGCGSPRLERVGPFSTRLKNMVNFYCPKTFDYQR